MKSAMLYFDHNAKAPLHPAAQTAWLEAQERYPANPSSQHRPGRRAEAALDQARDFLGAHLGCAPDTLVWTSGATEAANAVFAHLAAGAPPGARVWVSAVEHPCVAEAAQRYFPGAVDELPVNPDGVCAPGLWSDALAGGRPAAVAVMAANNETGVLQPWEAVLAWCRAAGVPLVSDATQWIGRLPAAGLGAVDYLLGSGHKCGAPVGVGFLKVPRGFRGLFEGGPQEEGRRAGTQNVAGVLAFEAALRACAGRFAEVDERVEARQAVERALLSVLPGARIVGAGARRLWNTILVLAPELADCRQRWVVRLDAAGVAVSSGSACASGREKPSRVLSAMGLSATDRALRLSGGWDQGAAEWAELVNRVAGVWAQGRGSA